MQPKALEALKGYTSISQAMDGDKGLIQGSAKLAGGMEQGVSGSKELNEATNNLPTQLIDAIDQFNSKSKDLQEGSTALVNGTKTLSNQLPALQSGVS